jgi:hypothetical protein
MTAATFGLHSKVDTVAIREVVIKTLSPAETITGQSILPALSLKPFTCRQKLQQ